MSHVLVISPAPIQLLLYWLAVVYCCLLAADKGMMEMFCWRRSVKLLVYSSCSRIINQQRYDLEKATLSQSHAKTYANSVSHYLHEEIQSYNNKVPLNVGNSKQAQKQPYKARHSARTMLKSPRQNQSRGCATMSCNETIWRQCTRRSR